MATKTEDGTAYPASAFAYVPDPETPSTWKLRLWESPDQEETARQVGMAVAALGKGFRGNKVEIPADDLPKVKARVLAAWLKTNDDKTRDDAPAVLKGALARNEKGQFVSLGQALSDNAEDVEKEGRVLSSMNRKRVRAALDVLRELMDAGGKPGDDEEELAQMLDGYTKGGMMYEADDEEEDDPLDLLLDAYMAAIRRGPIAAPLVDPIMELAREVEAVYRKLGEGEVEEAAYMAKNGMGSESCPVEALLEAYAAMLYMKGAEEIRKKTLELIAEGDRILYGDTEAMMDEMKTMRPITRTIKEENGNYVVYSSTGRKFGTYNDRKEAEARLRQIERFSKERLDDIAPRQLAVWRANLRLNKQTAATATVAQLIDDVLDSLPTDERLAIVKEAGLEQRYTLGPVYVPGVEDAHGEFTDAVTLQKALWEWVRKGNRTIFLQHSTKPAGEMVEMMTMPWPVQASLSVPNQGTTDYTFPAETPFMGVVWEPWAWDMVKAGKLRGYSIGGKAKRVYADLPAEALKSKTAVTKHPGHGDQAVHSPKTGPVGDRAMAAREGSTRSGGGSIPRPGEVSQARMQRIKRAEKAYKEEVDRVHSKAKSQNDYGGDRSIVAGKKAADKAKQSFERGTKATDPDVKRGHFRDARSHFDTASRLFENSNIHDVAEAMYQGSKGMSFMIRETL